MENNYEIFKPQILFNEKNNPSDIWFIFKDNKLILKSLENNTLTFTTFFDIKNLLPYLNRKYPIGSLGNNSYFCGELNSNISINNNLIEINLREASNYLDDISFSMAGKSSQILDWDNKSNYCGRCGSKTYFKNDERAKICPECNLIDYPRISPAIIVAVIKNDKLLLAHNSKFNNNRYSLIAGFVDSNETLEDCVRREVFEEIGIKIKNIKYLNSQP